ncbi:hypothetical protein J7E70_23655 [Variovorax paradoxus]|nr:hypothetical protein [Variovorax paradoxus]MBT2303449.1 hypothetical protein [Variovorax paradoxus]
MRGSIQPSSPGQSCDPALLLASCAAEQHHSRIVNSQLFGFYAATVGHEQPVSAGAPKRPANPAFDPNPTPERHIFYVEAVPGELAR